jgi:hypothetical protein
MFLLGHIGITVGIVYLLVSLWSSRKKTNSPLTPLIEDIDFRIVIIAAILPDIIDKTVGMIILRDEIANGRLFTHSIVVIGIISICSLIAVRIKRGHYLKTLFYVLALTIHLILDSMWENTHTLFWPLFGTSFPRLDIEISDYFTIILTDPYVYVTEILGTLIIITLFIRHQLFIKIHLFRFLKDGKLRIYSDK